jgi:hypothetical protein
MGISLNIMGQSWEYNRIHGNIMGISWQYHEFMGIPWDNQMAS